MTALNNLNNIGKAKLLHELFPDDIPQLLDQIKEVCADLKQTGKPMKAHGILV
jgi:hypothetical protein